MALIDWEVQRFISFNFKQTVTHARLEQFAEDIAKGLDFGTRKQSEKFEYLKCLLANLKVGWDSKSYLAISLDPNYYSSIPNRYRRVFENYRLVRNVIDEMVNAGHIELILGYKDPTTGIGVPSKIRAQDSIGGLLGALIDFSMFEEIRPEEVIILRDIEKKLVDYRDTPRIRDLRKELNIYNNLREKVKLSIKDIPYDILITNKDEVQQFSKVSINKTTKNQSIDIELKTTYLSRIFNNNSFSQGGRYYRGAESVLPEVVRNYIRINNRETCELDYSGLHLRMLYNSMNKSITTDPYVISTRQSPILRQFYKTISLIMINADNELNALRGIVNEYRGTEYRRFLPDISHATLKKYCNSFIEAHKEIKSKFYSGLGVKLQNIDSNISSRILKHFTSKGILVLCIHDSFIIDKRYKADLKAAMEREYLAEFPGFPPIIK